MSRISQFDEQNISGKEKIHTERSMFGMVNAKYFSN